jgi:hypothetical protein
MRRKTELSRTVMNSHGAGALYGNVQLCVCTTLHFGSLLKRKVAAIGTSATSGIAVITDRILTDPLGINRRSDMANLRVRQVGFDWFG